jgi:hypothetical protein
MTPDMQDVPKRRRRSSPTDEQSMAELRTPLLGSAEAQIGLAHQLD